MDEKYLGGHNTRKMGNVFREKLSMKPSEYLDRNCFLGRVDPAASRTSTAATQIGVGNLLWGNDFPHPEGTFPYTRELVRRRVPATCPRTRPAGSSGSTRSSVYGIDVDALAPLVERIGPLVEEVHGETPLQAIPMRRDVSVTESLRSPRPPIDPRAGDRRALPVGLPDAPRPELLDRPPPGGCRSPGGRAGASRSRSPTAGSSWPRPTTSAPGEVRALLLLRPRPRAVPHRRRRAPPASTPTARTSAPTSAVGGQVEGDCLRCPFHGWRFDGDGGACIEIPYGDGERIPAKARARLVPDASSATG